MLHRLDLGNSQQVSNDEESHVPDIGTFISVPPIMPPAPLPNPVLTLVAPSPNSTTLDARSPDPTQPSIAVPPISCDDWQNLVAGDSDQAPSPYPNPSKLIVIDYQHLSPIYSTEDLAKNKHQLDMTDVPNAILQMVYNKIYIPLLMLMTSALSKICSNDNLKF